MRTDMFSNLLQISENIESIYDTRTPSPETRVPDYDTLSQTVYVKACARLGIVPSTYFTRNLTEKTLSIPYHGIGAQGAKAVAIAMVVRQEADPECMKMHG